MATLSRSPTDLLKESKALVLSVSDNHATIFLCSSTAENENIKSLLKLNVVPAHRDELSCAKIITSARALDDDVSDEQSSHRVLDFLRNFDFRLMSESGAEYSYYTATEKSSWRNYFGLLKSYSAPKVAFTVELISPASGRQIERSLPAPAMSFIEETPEMYESIVKPVVQTLIEGGSLSWVQNVVNGTKEAERLLLDADDFILNIDTKWRSHPDAKIIPREEWCNDKSVKDLYCLAIVKDSAITSLRELREQHIPMLKAILNQGRETIERVYGVASNKLRIFVHYQPQFYHFHVHFTRLENEIGCQVERSHLLSDVIQNLEIASDYYVKRTITYKLKTSSELFSLLENA